MTRFLTSFECATIKFVCKDFWFEVFGKQVDKLQTNNRGVYMLQDSRHRPLSCCSPSAPRQEGARQQCVLHATFTAGLIRGALHGLGVGATVGLEVEEPRCLFTITVAQVEAAAPKARGEGIGRDTYERRSVASVPE